MSKSKTDPPESTLLFNERLDVGLAAAFGPNAAFSGGTAGDFLATPDSRLHSLPRVRLPNAGEDDPFVKSYDVPLNLEATGRYEFFGEIGRGGMGTIFWARDCTLGCELAIKVLAEKYRNVPKARERFVEEAQIAGQLQHPGIVPVHELGEFDDGLPYITMKLVKGQTFVRLLAAREDPSQDWPRFLGIFEQICQTLAYAHSRGVIHRDLKPGNVMVGEFGEVQVMDWGLAKVLTQSDFDVASQSQSGHGEAGQTRGSDTTNKETVAETAGPDSTRLATRAGTIMGTPAYISPEQARGDMDCIDERTDVYSLGAILYEILTGRPPFEGADSNEVLQNVQNEEPAPPSQRNKEVPQLLEAACLKALAKDPADRHALASELAHEVESWQEVERKKAEQARKDSEALYHSLVETLPVILFRKDLQSRFTFANQRFCKSMGRSLSDIVGKTNVEISPTELAEKYRRDDQHVIDTGKRLETNEEQVDGERTIYVQTIKTPVYDSRGETIGTQAVCWDISDRKVLEKALARATEELAQVRRELEQLRRPEVDE